MRRVLIVSHGTLAEGIIESAKVILGDFVKAESCCLKIGMGIDTFETNIKEIVKNYEVEDEIIVLADLKGGSPYRATISAISENDLINNSSILTGVNLPMLINVVMKDKLSEDDINEILSEAKSGIDKFKVQIDDEEDL